MVGKGEHYFTKASVAQFSIVNGEIKVGDEVLISGPSTGEERLTLTKFKVNGQDAQVAQTGDKLTFQVPFRVRLSDKMFVIKKESN